MTARNLVLVALPLLATCIDGGQAPAPAVEAQPRALGKVPPSEVATWQRVGLGNSPHARFLQAVAWDEKRGVVVMFGGEAPSPFGWGAPQCNQETWEWSPAAGKWTNRTGTGTAPGARAGASLVYDSTENIFVLFGGRTTSGVNYEDTWEWDPTGGAWTDRTGAGNHPSARGQHGMVYQKSTGKLLLFGGGTIDTSAVDGTSVSTSLKDTWEYDPVAHSWVARSPTTGPSARHDFGLVWDASRNRAILFGGLQVDPSSTTSVAKQDVWEWDPTGSGTWTDRTALGTKPSVRYGHALAYDGSRKKVVLFGGSDINTAANKNDLWDLDPTGFTWTQRLSGSEAGLPAARIYASLVSDNTKGRLELVAGALAGSGSSGDATSGAPSLTGSNEVWELDPATPAFTNKTPASDLPPPRSEHAMAYNQEVNNETWEYRVTNLGNGEGCTADSVQSCASGNCVDGVCCDAASCTGACKSCNVPGSEGTCKLAPAGMEVPGSCENGQACDGAGTCKSKNGQACTGNATCASGFCVDGICCDSTCTGACVACNLSGRAGQCSPHPAGTDPKGECGVGTEACKSSCDGAGACSFPGEGTTCGSCGYCDRKGQCNEPLPTCVNTNNGGTTGSTTSIRKGTGGSSGATGKGGAGGDVSGSGGMGGDSGAGGTRGSGGAGSGSGGATGRSGSGGNSMSGSGNAGAGGDAAGGAGASQGGASGAPTAGSGGASGGREGSGTTNRDGSSDGVGTGVAPKASRSGCSCAVGAAQSQRSGLVPLSALVGVALVFRWLRRKNRGFTGAQR